jgi:dTDP-4-amino-4,6-dideoxygalactose transaminase
LIPFNKICFFPEELKEIEEINNKVLHSKNYLNGNYNRLLEQKISEHTGWNYVLLVGNCTDALEIILRAHTTSKFINTIGNAGKPNISAIINAGKEPVFHDVELDGLIHKTYSGDCLFTNLYGNLLDDSILNKNTIVDSAQHFSSYKQSKARAVCYSFYPTKPLGALSDGGAICTDDLNLYNKCKEIAQYGGEDCNGRNSRMNEFTAAILTVRLKYYIQHDEKRKEIARFYDKFFSDNGYKNYLKSALYNIDNITTPSFNGRYSTTDNPVNKTYYNIHLYTLLIENREDTIKHLRDNNIETKIHYSFNPKIDRLVNTNLITNHILSIPIYSDMDYTTSYYIAKTLKEIAKPIKL